MTTPVLDAKSSGGPHERHLVLHQFGACCKALPYCAGPFPFHMGHTAISACNQPLSSGALRSLRSLRSLEPPQTAHVFARVTQHCAMHTVAG